MYGLRSRQRRVRLVGGPSLIAGSPSQWLRSLRWVAVLGMLFTVLVGRQLVPGLRIAPVLATIGAIALFNVYGVLAKRPKEIVYDLAFDVVALGVVLWFSGGVGNPFAVFLTFQIMVTGILAGAGTTGRIAMLVVAIALALLLAPPIAWESAGVHAEQVRLVGHLTALVGVAVFMGFSSYAYGRKLDELRSEAARAARFADLGRVASGIAHELNTPLATMLVASQELVAEVKAGRAEEAVPLGEVIAGQAQRASDIIALLRGQVRTQEQPEAIDVGALLSALVPVELEALRYRGRIVLNVRPGVWAWAIPAAVRQIVSNLLKNAVEATAHPEPGRIEVSAIERERGIVVTVRDNGGGIRPDELQRIGQPFHTTKSSSGGSGLGLYVSGLLARQMNAELQIVADDAHTTVSLTLRRAEREAEG